MLDLLVGCRATYSDDNVHIEGVVVKITKADRHIAWLLDSKGRIHSPRLRDIKIHPDDVNFIISLNKDYSLRKEILTKETNRFEILDL